MRGPLECQAAGAVSEKIADPLDQIRADPLSVEEREEGRKLHVVETPFHIAEESGALIAEALEGFNVVL